MSEKNDNIALVGGGCFWCVEACYLRIDGIEEVVSGYAGGTSESANYGAVCDGDTQHAEVVRIRFDTARIQYTDILDYFWRMHDPTQLNRQGADVGTQYRSVIYYYTPLQRDAAISSRDSEQANHKNKIVTVIEAAPHFYPAEQYHQQYFDQHPQAPYCARIIAPKLKKAGLK